ncbi:NUDIX hydrolase [Peribacillus frigoritolerans]|uniref:NUDIX hydrolase n=1 Tax=Peribacillus frigoritolerans TaxID=450367 RepID=UPI00105A6BED|nr:NUDIX hydrolase [Peribacillus frigoritolerans]TDL82430.1 NUDIX domain-containing protein [Peribacillus frigoritolerans]
MITDKKIHRVFGVYGIYTDGNKILVINKNRGPYINRYDLPGGSLEDGESLTVALKREFLEETGFEVKVDKNLGIADFMLPWAWNEYEFVHHIAAYYLVEVIRGDIKIPHQFEGQDSLGALWLSEEEANINNASPLLLKAFRWLKGSVFDPDVEIYDDWEIRM